jgi:CRP-like cAMP-binding protein
MALLQDQIPYEVLYRTMKDEMDVVAQQLEELVERLEAIEQEAARPVNDVPITHTHQPKTFICHASEDKERFVVEFAKRLRARGVDAWLDQWEILGGEGLVERIFDDAFSECDVFIVVLSKHSVEKPWVKLELNTAVVKRINDGALLIPVVLDGVAVPNVVSSLRWIRIPDLEHFDGPLDDVVRSVFGVYPRPPLGDVPAYVGGKQLVGLNQQDGTVLQLLVRSAFDRDQDEVDGAACMKEAEQAGISAEAYEESLVALETEYLIEVPRGLNDWRGQPFLTPAGYSRALPAVMGDSDDFVRRLKALLVNEFPSGTSADELAERLGEPRRAVIAVLRELDSRQLVKITESNPRMCHVYSVSPLLGRDVK